jgi:hypothetical protein
LQTIQSVAGLVCIEHFARGPARLHLHEPEKNNPWHIWTRPLGCGQTWRNRGALCHFYVSPSAVSRLFAGAVPLPLRVTARFGDRRPAAASCGPAGCFRMIAAKARNASLASPAVGNAAATSGSRTTTEQPEAYRDAYGFRLALLKSYSGRILSTASARAALVLLCGFFIVCLAATPPGPASYSNSAADVLMVRRPCFTPFVLMRTSATLRTSPDLPFTTRTSRQLLWSRWTCRVERIER